MLECDAQGTRRLMLNLCHCGTERAAQQDLAPLRKVATPISDNVGARSFVTLQSEHDDDLPRGRSYYTTGAGVASLAPALLDHALRAIQEPGAERGKISFTQNGGAVGGAQNPIRPHQPVSYEPEHSAAHAGAG